MAIRVGKVLTFAYVKPEAAAPGTELAIIIRGKPRQARILDKPVYEPGSLRPRIEG